MIESKKVCPVSHRHAIDASRDRGGAVYERTFSTAAYTSRLRENSKTPLPSVAAQNRQSVFAATYRAATKGSGTACRLFPQP
jgi:hypothetical protein